MHGRRRELNIGLDLLRGAEAGRGGILLVEGEPGIGKSRILRELSDAAARHRFSLVCDAADKPLDQLPDGLSGPHAASWSAQPLLALSAGVGPGAGGRDGGDAGVSPGPAAAPSTPGRLLIVVDDVHCADPETLRRLDGLLRRTQLSAPLWILARSTMAHRGDAQQLFDRLGRAGAVRMRLAPLDDHAVAAVAADLLDARPAKSLLALAAEADGNPLLLVELLAGLQEEGRVQIDQGSAELVPGELPRRLRGVVYRWVAGLSPGARELLEVGAVLGESFQVDHVAALLGETPAGLLCGIESALAAGILVAGPDALVFRRALVWRAILDGVPAPVRCALHRQAGEFLLQVGSSATDAAAHLISGSRPCSPLSLTRLDAAAGSLLASAPRTAADLAVKSLELTGPVDGERIGRIETAVAALTAATRLSDAEMLAQSALAGPLPGAAETRLHGRLAAVLLHSGRLAEAASEAAQVLSEPGLSGPSRDDAEFAMMLGMSAASQEDPAATTLAEEILADPGQRGDAVVTAALLAQALNRWRESQLSAALDLARLAVRRGRVGPVASLFPRVILVGMLARLGELDEAGRLVSDVREDARQLGLAGQAVSVDFLAARLALLAGRPAEAVAGAEEALGRADQLGAHLFSLDGLATLATVALRSGDLRVAGEQVDRFQARIAEYGVAGGHDLCLITAAQVAEARDGAERSAAQVAALYAAVTSQPAMLVAEASVAAWLVRFALRAQDRAHAGAVSAAADRLAADNPGFGALAAAAAHARGLLRRDPAALRQAATSSCDPWTRASAAEDLSLLLREQKDFAGAALSLEESLTGYERTAALRDARRVRRRLRGLGIRRRHCTYAHRPKSGWESLTDTERSVSALVAQGLTNQKIASEMFLSPHTVAFHLRQVFRKLDIGSRVDLARQLTERSRAEVQPDLVPRPG
jgi:DNA-binding CsgD family transcriptional regulator